MRKLITFFIALIMAVMILMLIALQSCTTPHRPRYKHWDKGYYYPVKRFSYDKFIRQLYAPVKPHNPTVK